MFEPILRLAYSLDISYKLGGKGLQHLQPPFGYDGYVSKQDRNASSAHLTRSHRKREKIGRANDISSD